MARFHDQLNDTHVAFIKAQRMFFVATSPLSDAGRVNLSPKGYNSFRMIGPNRVAYADLGGSDAETLAPDAWVALAASELPDAANGKPPGDFPVGAQAIVASIKADAKLPARASAVVARILAASELEELWQGTDDYARRRADAEGSVERLK